MVAETGGSVEKQQRNVVIAPNGAKTAPVEIGSSVFIGARVIILKGSIVGNESVVGAGSVVSGGVKEGSVVGGTPAREIRR